MSQKTSATLVVAFLLTVAVVIGEAADSDPTGHEKLVIRSPALGQSLTSGVGGGLENGVPTFCEEPDIKDLVPPNGFDCLAASQCFAGGTFEHTERFFGDNKTLTGVGFWFRMDYGLPDQPRFIIRIYLTGTDGCPMGDPIFVASCDVVNIGPGSGSISDPIEYFCDFSANGVADFFKETGVEYSISIMNNNCPGEGNWAYWATGTGDGLFGCILAPDFGFPDWAPLEDAGMSTDFAMYLCNEPVVSVGDPKVRFTSLHLTRAIPNPFGTSAQIQYVVSTASDESWVSLRVYDPAGRLVRTLVNAPSASGIYDITWDGRSDAGVLVAGGVYFYQLKVDGETRTRRMILVR